MVGGARATETEPGCGQRNTRVAEAEPACGRSDTRVAEASPTASSRALAAPARLGLPSASGTSQQDRGDARATGEARLAAGATRARHDLPDSVQPRTGNAHALRSGDYRGWRRHDAGPLAVCD